VTDSPAVRQVFVNTCRQLLGIDLDLDRDADASLEDLEIDSLSMMEVLMEIEDQLAVQLDVEKFEGVDTVSSAVDRLADLVAAHG